MGAEEEMCAALRPAVEAAGLEIWDVERSGTCVRVMVDRAGGVDLDAISQLSGVISAVLDEREDLVPAGRYTLEVSSPGLERRLRYPRHFASYIGQEVAVKISPGAQVPRRLRGTLLAATGEDITVRAELPGGEPQDVRLPLALVERASTVFSWGQPASRPLARQPGRKHPGKSQTTAHSRLAAAREAR